eukprot:TRINITY_DN13458_c0_g2_i3.p1 TRINITY_DN13458_c0_g2~~TRINITY_DN13458_c0_g2_i3.p1  ORF type:complete len:195 (-),score=52.74 TRINITY_DN13458_c0_g2_i3:228-812(-)
MSLDATFAVGCTHSCSKKTLLLVSYLRLSSLCYPVPSNGLDSLSLSPSLSLSLSLFFCTGMFLWGDRIEPWQKAIQPYGLYQVCRFLIGRLLKLGRKGAAESLVKVRGVFEEVEDILKDGRRFLCGHQFTVADIAFCSLVAPLLAPEQYGGTSLPLDKFPKEAKEVRDELLKGAIGKYVMRVYKDKRPTKKKDN